MTRGILKWRPETCACKFQFDIDQPDGERIDCPPLHLVPLSITPCTVHSGIRDKRERLLAAHEENYRWHHALGFILDETQQGVQNVDTGDGIRREFRPGFQVKRRFAANRKLMVDMQGFSAAEKQRMQGLLDTELGVGKVLIE